MGKDHPDFMDEDIENPCKQCGGEVDGDALEAGVGDMCSGCMRLNYEEGLKNQRDALLEEVKALKEQRIQLRKKDTAILKHLARELGTDPQRTVRSALLYLMDHLGAYRKEQRLRALTRKLFKPAPGALRLNSCEVWNDNGEVIIKRREKLTIHEHLRLDDLADALVMGAIDLNLDIDVLFDPPLGEPDYPLGDGLTSEEVSRRIVKIVKRYMKRIGIATWNCRVFWKGDYEEDGVYPEVVVVSPKASKEVEGELRRVLVGRSRTIGWDVHNVLMTTAFQGSGRDRVYAVLKEKAPT